MSEIKVLGHLAPDTDTTCSPIVYAWYLSKYKNEQAKAYVTGELNRETKFVLDYFELPTPETIDSLKEGDDFFIIDTNNPDELIEGYDKATLVGLIDHHKLAGLILANPIDVTIKTYGCSATVVWEIIKEDIGNGAPKHIYGLLLACILSDTLNGNSPTTTQNDLDAISELAELAEIEVNEFSDKMFAAKSDLSGMDPKEILTSDSKIYKMGAKQARVSVLETTKPENALAIAAELNEAAKQMKTNGEVDYVFMFVIDILNKEATPIVCSEDEKAIVSEAFNVDMDKESVKLEGVVSRKKQIVPKLEPVASKQ